MFKYKKIPKHWKYILESSYWITLSNTPEDVPWILSDFINIYDISKNLHIKKGYAWDGPSGPTIDTKSFMRGSLVHDALYQLMREGLLGKSWRLFADKLLRKICLEDGMIPFRAWYVYRAVRLFGGFAIRKR